MKKNKLYLGEGIALDKKIGCYEGQSRKENLR